MEVDASRQKEERNRRTYMAFMKGKCYGCGSPDHAKKDGQHNRDICGHCKKVGHRSPICFSKYMGKPIAAKAAASQESPEASGSKEKATASATQNTPAKDSKGQADLLAKLMAHVKGFTPLCPTWVALDGDGLVFALPLWIPPEV